MGVGEEWVHEDEDRVREEAWLGYCFVAASKTP